MDIFDTIDGLFAYYSGATDSGLSDAKKQSELKKYLNDDLDRANILLGNYVREHFFKNDETINNYGLESLKEFYNWLSEKMGIDY